MNLLETLKIDQIVWSAELGECKVIELDNTEEAEYPLVLESTTEGHRMHFTKDGKYYPDCVFPSVFLSDPSALFGYKF